MLINKRRIAAPANKHTVASGLSGRNKKASAGLAVEVFVAGLLVIA